MSDQPVQATNDDAQLSKQSCVEQGYFEDKFIHHFVKKKLRRAPLINRGYFTRHSALQQLIQRFTSLGGGTALPKQIICLGAGFDTTWFHLQEQGAAPACYFEIDFAQVTCQKAGIIGSHAELYDLIGPLAQPQNAGTGRIQSERYCLLPGDLRDAPAIQQALIQAGLQAELPTLVLAECVLVYMEPQHSAELLRSLGRLLPTAACVVYEQIRPHDAFGQQMLRNLQCRGCPLRGLHATPSLDAHEQRLTSNNWSRARAVDLNTIYQQHIHPAEKRRIERLEIFDEFEEWHLMQEHYCIAIGINDAAGLLGTFDFDTFSAPGVPGAHFRRAHSMQRAS